MTARPSTASIAAAKPAPLHVVIIGGGIGGLTLAQGLKKSGVKLPSTSATVPRPSAYRATGCTSVPPAACLALRDCLPPQLFHTFVLTCGKPTQGIHFVTEHMKVLLALNDFNVLQRFQGDGVARHRSVSRITLRQVLLFGLEDFVHFGKTFVRYEEAPTGRVVAHFEDGTAAEGDVLVAAHGGACAGSSCHMRNASIPGLSALPARCSSTRRRAARSPPCCGTA
jgi:2-polyprenyl-6-methoxyphenol hydroxylase-like FAD-dependent oxidoreductase